MSLWVNEIFGKSEETALISSETLGDVQADVKISEAHTYESDVTTTTLENGTQVSDHVINHPVQATINFEMVNASGTKTKTYSDGSWEIISNAPKDVFDKLSRMVEKRELVTLTTEHAIYNNMIIKSFQPLHRAPYKRALQIAVTLQQINFVTVDRITLQSSGTTSGDLNTSLSSTVDSGRAAATHVPEVNSSVLSDFKNSMMG